MSVFTKYCDKLIFEAVNNIQITNDNMIQELNESNYLKINSFNELKKFFSDLTESEYVFNEGFVDSISYNNIKRSPLSIFNPKSASKDNLTFVSSKGKLFIESNNQINAIIEKDEYSNKINLIINNDTINESFNVNKEPISKINLSFIKK